MKLINVANGPAEAPAIIQGCMRMPALDTKAPADLAAAADVELSRDDWYKLYLASGKFLP